MTSGRCNTLKKKPRAKSPPTKKPGHGDSRWKTRFIWSEDQHKDFVRAVVGWGVENMKPEQMKNLTVEGDGLNAVAKCHLQKVSICHIERTHILLCRACIPSLYLFMW